MPGNGICRDPGFKNFLVRRGHSPPRAPPLGIPEPTAELLRKAVENTDDGLIDVPSILTDKGYCCETLFILLIGFLVCLGFF